MFNLINKSKLFDFLSDGEHIAIASQDGNISVHAVYDEGTTYRRVGTCSVSRYTLKSDVIYHHQLS